MPLADPRHLISVYLERVQAVRTRDVFVTLLEAEIVARTQGDALDEVHDVLEDNTRRTDLIYRTGPSSWLIAAASREPGMDTLTRRMQDALRDGQGSSRDGALPDVAWRVEGCWRIEDEGAPFRSRFLDLCARRRSVHEPSAGAGPGHESRA